ncbi:hypothetical protein [Streptomyces orinoci]|uniref:Uncharacterized protein n=1 Tax=Streptomyces orinoci TaxID=67339 RepID=A0ABV3JV51_STRON|nr:hypothetical protein [Streptomyces orinoci]
MNTAKRSARRRTAASAAAAALLAAAGIGLATPSAVAGGTDTVSVSYTCTGPGAPSGDNPIQLTVTAPASVPQGGSANLTVSATTQMTAPIDLPANTVTAEMNLAIGGANSGSVQVTGATNDSAVASGSTVAVTGGTASVELDSAGTTTFTPGDIAVHVFGVTVNCSVSGDAPVAASTEVGGS